MRRTVFVAALAAGMLTGGRASADPTKGNGVAAGPVPARGAGLHQRDQGAGIAGHVVVGEGNIQPVEDMVTYTYTDPAAGEHFSPRPWKTGSAGAARRGSKETCVGATNYEDPDPEEATADSEIRAFVTPRNE